MANPARFVTPASLLVSLLLTAAAPADVRINEFVASAPERLLHFEPGRPPHAGLTTPWQDPAFDDALWSEAPGPFGFGAFAGTTIATDTSAVMQGRVPALYLRRTFAVTAAQAASAASVRLIVRANDGFIAFLNGVEVGRRNMGPAGSFAFHDQPAFNADPAATAVTIDLGPATAALREGDNLLCLQVHNVMSSPGDAASFLGQAGLELAGSPATTLVAPADPWRYFAGITEPSGGLVDHGLLRREGARVLWASPEYNDFTWPHGPGPVGFDTATPADYVVGTDLRDELYDRFTSVYTRTAFTVSAGEAGAADPLSLEIDYDDGLIVYLNGREVVRRNVGAPGTVTPHTASADSAHAANGDNGGVATGREEIVDLGPAADWLIAGDNILGVQLHNAGASSSDLVARVTLRSTGAAARALVVPTDRVRYFIGNRSPHGSTGDIELPDPVLDASADWIELHNDGAAPVDLTGWSMTDRASNPRKWSFPDGTTIPAGGYLVVMATELEAGPADGASYLHAAFKLGSGGEYLGLVDAGGAVVDELAPEYPPQSLRNSYGRDATGAFVYFDRATPGAANPATGFAALLGAPTASPAGGFHAPGVSVTLAAPDEGCEIRYTLDGSDPTATHGTVYTTPLSIYGSLVLRAVALRADAIASDVSSHTFLIGQSSARRSVAAVCLSGDAGRTFYGPNASGGPAAGSGVLAIGGGRYVTADIDDTWESGGDPAAYNVPMQRGRAFEKQAALEVFPLQGDVLRTGFGLRLAASDWSRPRMRLTGYVGAPFDPYDYRMKPSFNLYFRDDFGTRPLEYPLIPDNPVASFEDVRLRAGKNDMIDPFITDELMRRIYLATGQQSSRGTFATLYVNGVYKGYYNLCERIRDEFMRQHHGGSADWDVRQVNDIESGDAIAWNRMMAFLQTADLTELATYARVHDHLDVDNAIDYLLTNGFAAMWDWPGGNWAAARERSTQGRWRFYMWDAEGAFGIYDRRAPGTYDIFIGDVNGDQVPDASEEGYRLDIGAEARTTTWRSVAAIYTLLRASPEFRLRWADRAQKHFFHGGALTRESMEALWYDLRAQVEPLIAFETGVTIDDRIRRDWLASPVRRNTFFAQMRRYGLWVDTLAPELSQHGGDVAAGATVAIANPNATGTVYYTLDGSDPRAPGGAAVGVAYAGPLTLTRSRTLKARVLAASGEWSPLQEATFSVEDSSRLLVTELMYNPLGGDGYEFIELKNVGTGAAYLEDAAFTSGITFTFPADAIVAPGAHVVVARNPATFATRYPGVTTFATGYTGKLANEGERVTLQAADGRTLVTLVYGTAAPWPTEPDGDGRSLVPVDPEAGDAPDDPASWRASTLLHGSPGADDPEPVPASIVASPPDWDAADGRRTSISVQAAGNPPPDYRWQISRDGGGTWEDLAEGSSYSGTASATLQFLQVGFDLTGAQFRCVVFNGLGGEVASAPAQVTVHPPARLLNLSIRAQAQAGDGLVIAGFVVRGATPARLLVRAVGERLRDFDVFAPLADPQLEILRHVGEAREPVVANDDWVDAPDLAALLAASDTAGAFPIGSTDPLSSALVFDFAPGIYSAQARNAGEPGIVLLEIYDLTSEGTPLVNISSRAYVGHGEQVLIPGFVVQGEVSQRFLVRAVGPGLTEYDVTGLLDDPRLRLVEIGIGDVSGNDDWDRLPSEASAVAAAADEVGAFALEPGSRDAAMLVALPPGIYTAVVSGADDATGIVLVEVYAMP